MPGWLAVLTIFAAIFAVPGLPFRGRSAGRAR
jgi:hypothetical protein